MIGITGDVMTSWAAWLRASQMEVSTFGKTILLHPPNRFLECSRPLRNSGLEISIARVIIIPPEAILASEAIIRAVRVDCPVPYPSFIDNRQRSRCEILSAITQILATAHQARTSGYRYRPRQIARINRRPPPIRTSARHYLGHSHNRAR